MPTVHPTFYPGDGWCCQDATAPTIAELLDKLGSDYVCQDYYPVGVDVPRETLPHGLPMGGGSVRCTQLKNHRQYAAPPGEATHKRKPPPAPRQPPAPKTHPEAPLAQLEPIYQPGRERDEAVATRWSEGRRTQREIARELGMGVNSVASILCRLRERGDQRAAPRR